MPEIQPSGNDTLFRVVVLVLGTIPIALVAAVVLISRRRGHSHLMRHSGIALL